MRVLWPSTKTDRAIAALLVVVFLMVCFAKVNNSLSDPRGTLLVSESILSRQTLKLDYYGEPMLTKYGYVIQTKNGHQYYYFPIGSSIASVPFVAVAKVFGVNIADKENRLQRVIAAFTSVATLIFLLRLSGLFLGSVPSILISSAFWFGTSLASTGGTALWSHNFATLFALIAIYLVIKSAKRSTDCRWALVAVCLFAAYLCRPTFSLLPPFLLTFLFSYQRPAALKSGALLVLLLAGFVGFSFLEFGQPLPDYYLPQRLNSEQFAEALYGNLFSPARGLLIYSPFILTAWLCYGDRSKDFGLKKTWLLIGLGWPLLHLAVVSRFPHWWAGWCYGTRFLTDVMPGLFLLTLFTWPTTIGERRGRLSSAALAISVLLAVLLNTAQGLFNPYTTSWCYEPNIDENPQYLFDWRYPPFLATAQRNQERIRRHNETVNSRTEKMGSRMIPSGGASMPPF